MADLKIDVTGVTLNDPFEPVVFDEPKAKESFTIEVSGMGQLVGLSYTVPAHATGSLSAELQTSALTSDDVKNLNEMAMGMLDASYQEEIREHEKTTASANLSPWSWFFGGGAGSASYEKTRDTMKKKGLTDGQISELMAAFMERATSMSNVKIEFYINNENNDYQVSGDLYLYTISGKIKTEKATEQYRMLADSAAAGGPPPAGGGAPSSGKVIPLS